MTKKSKIIVITSAILGGIAVLYFGIRYIALVQAYNNNITEDTASQMIDDATSSITGDTLVPDDVTANADAQKGSEVNEEDILNVCDDGYVWDPESLTCVSVVTGQ